MSVASPSSDVWLRYGAASLNYALSYDRIRKLVKRRMVTTRRLPGSVPEILASDLEKVLRDSVVPAQQPASK